MTARRYFIVDLGVNFRTAVVTKDGHLLADKKRVAAHYLRGFFIIDVASCLPFGYITCMAADQEDKDTRSGSVRLLRLLRLIKLLRLLRGLAIFQRWEEQMFQLGVIWKLGRLALLILFMSHWLACGWYFAGTAKQEFFDDLNVTKVAWVDGKYPNMQPDDVPLDEAYYTSFYFAACSVLMVGYTEPGFVAEKVMVLTGFFVGAMVMSLIIGNVSDIIANANPGATAIKRAEGVITSFLSDSHVSSILTRRVRSHVTHYHLSKGTSADIKMEIFEYLPQSMQEELAKELGYIDDTNRSKTQAECKGCLSRIPFFQNLHSHELILIGCRMKHQIAYSPNFEIINGKRTPVDSFIMQEGHRGTEMWIVESGCVTVEKGLLDTTMDGKLDAVERRVKMGYCTKNDIFGEMAVLVQEAAGLPLERQRTAYCSDAYDEDRPKSEKTSMFSHGVGYVKLFALSYDDVQALRLLSPAIDASVAKAVASLKANRPTLFSGEAADAHTRHLHELDKKLEDMNTHFMEELAEIKKLIARR
eukprot:COSAG01_NODE_7448_length_3208_cov_2.236732_1_plen_530_part_00